MVLKPPNGKLAANPVKEELAVQVKPQPDPDPEPQCGPGRPPEEANPYVAAVVGELGEHGFGPDPARHGRPCRLVGLLGAVEADGSRALYDDPSLDKGVQLDNSDIVVWAPLPADDRDGLIRDAIWVKPGSVIIYWSKRPMTKSKERVGGNGFPEAFTGI